MGKKEKVVFLPTLISFVQSIRTEGNQLLFRKKRNGKKKKKDLT